MKLQQTVNGQIFNITGSTVDLMKLVVNNTGPNGIGTTEQVKRFKLWNAIEEQLPEDYEDKTPEELIEVMKEKEIKLSENQFKKFKKLVQEMKWNLSGKDVQKFIIDITGDNVDDE